MNCLLQRKGMERFHRNGGENRARERVACALALVAEG